MACMQAALQQKREVMHNHLSLAIFNRESEPFFDADLAYKTKSSDKELNMCTPRVKCEVVIHRPQRAVGAVVELGGWTCQ